MHFFIALVLHVIVFVLLIFSSNLPLRDASMRDAISAYIIPMQTETLIKKIKNKKRTVIKKALSLQPPMVEKVKESKKSEPEKSIHSNENLVSRIKQPGKNILLALLHQAIAAKQSYPPAALMLKQAGIVRIRFLLFPDGHIMQISLLKSSGFSTLDASALSAVYAITPVKVAATYLQKETFFSVDVVFE